jgi:hypothetical protein
MKFLVHFGRRRPIGRRLNTSPRTMHAAMAAGMSEITGRKQVVKLALTGSCADVSSSFETHWIISLPRRHTGKCPPVVPGEDTIPPHFGLRIGSLCGQTSVRSRETYIHGTKCIRCERVGVINCGRWLGNMHSYLNLTGFAWALLVVMQR